MDDWTTSASAANFGIDLGNPTRLITNVATWLTGGIPGSVLILSFDGVSLDNYLVTDGLTAGGYTYLIDPSDAAWGNRGLFDAVFLDYTGAMGVDHATMAAELSAYVLSGGNVFLVLGTGYLDEAHRFNPFLNRFGLNAEVVHAGFTTYDTTPFQSQGANGAALFAGVNELLVVNGNSLSQGGVNDAQYAIDLFQVGGWLGVSAAATAQSVVPEPATIVLLALGLAPVLLLRRVRVI